MGQLQENEDVCAAALTAVDNHTVCRNHLGSCNSLQSNAIDLLDVALAYMNTDNEGQGDSVPTATTYCKPSWTMYSKLTLYASEQPMTHVSSTS
jgi:hypothetical protein